MPIPKEVLDSLATDIAEAEGLLAQLVDIVADMRLSGMDTKAEDDKMDKLTDDIRHLKAFYGRQKAKSS